MRLWLLLLILLLFGAVAARVLLIREPAKADPADPRPDPPAASAPAESAPQGALATQSPLDRPQSDAALRPWEPNELGFPNLASERGLDYVNRSGAAEKPTVLDANGAGVAVIDLQGDGDLDVVFSQGLPLLGDLVRGPGADLEVFHNSGSAHFERRPGPGLSGWWTGLATGDIDADGDADLVAGGFGDLRLLLQEDSGALIPAPGTGLVPDSPNARWIPGEERGPGAPPMWVSSLALLDADRDGYLDLYAGQYLDLDPIAPPLGHLGEGALSLPCAWKGHTVFCGPRGLTPQPDRLLRGRGDGTFEDVTQRWLGPTEPGYTLAVIAFDADADGDPDLYVANDSVPNQLWINQLSADRNGSGSFTDLADPSGVAVNSDGAPEAGMGIAAGDVNRDGILDLAVTNFSGEPTQLYFGAERGFQTETYRRGLNQASRRLLSWGVHLADFDGDGALELFTGNGHVYPQADRDHTGTRYAQPDTLWSFPDGRASLRAARWSNSVLHLERGTRGTALGDLDGNGSPDLVLNYIDTQAGLGINHLAPASHHWLELRCEGPADWPDTDAPRTPRDGTGARIVISFGAPAESPDAPLRLQLGAVSTSGSYQSANSPWVYFGLGEAETYAEIRVFWPSGAVDVLESGPADQRLWIREGEGLIRSEPLVR